MTTVDDEILEGNVQDLELKGVIGFDGSIIKGFVLHPDSLHVVYPLGNKVIIYDWSKKTQDFLSGHTNTISAIDVSKSGKYVASGQINHIGFKARVILWDYEKRAIISQHEIHKVRVEAVSFSSDDQFLYTLGGRDCGSLIVWDIAQGKVLCGSEAAHGIQGDATTILPMNRRGPCFLSAGDNHLAMWLVNRETRKLRSVDVSLGKLKRVILCMDVNERDEICHCGTATGDVLKIRLNYHHDMDVLEPAKHPQMSGCFARLTKKKLPVGQVYLYSQGVRSIRRLFSGPLIIGAGDGTLELVEETKGQIPNELKGFGVSVPSIPALKALKATNVFTGVTSIQLMNKDTTILVGTKRCEIFKIDMNTFNSELIVTCHTSTIYDVAFPYNFSDVFATASKNNVRVWSTKTLRELLRIRVPNFSASSVLFSHDGKSILTGWNDGIIRSFTPLTGRLIYSILNAHNKGVSALATTHKGDILVSGGCEGQVRLWSISPYRQELVCTLKEHKAPISAVDVNKEANEAVSAGTDGTCIIWDLKRQCRRQVLFGTTLFMCARYYPSDVQILTGGSDRKLSYWEVLDGSLVREIEGSRSGAVNSLDINSDGEIFVSGGNDQIVKLWKYQDGITTHIGMGHSSAITATRFSPDENYIVTTDGAGAIFLWKCPYEKRDLKQKSTAKINESSDTKQESPKDKKDEEEIIQDLPTARSEKSETCRCCCACPQTCEHSLNENQERFAVDGANDRICYDKQEGKKIQPACRTPSVKSNQSAGAVKKP